MKHYLPRWKWTVLMPLVACLIVVLSTAVFLSLCDCRPRKARAAAAFSYLPAHLAEAVVQLREDMEGT